MSWLWPTVMSWLWPTVMSWLWASVCLLCAHFHPQALGVTVTCQWDRYFLIGGNISGACHVGPAPVGCGAQSLLLTVAGEQVLAYRYTGDSAHFTVPGPAERTLHLRCQLTCAGLKPLPYCDITLQGGYPPSAPAPPVCHIPFDSVDVICSWEPGQRPLLPVNYTLHWEQFGRAGEQEVKAEVEGGVRSAVIPRLSFRHGTMSVWVTAHNPLGQAESETLSFDTLDIEQPLAPNITHHSVPPLEIFWDLECDPSAHMTADSDRSCEVQYRIRGQQAWTQGEEDAQDSFLFIDPQPFSEYDFRVRCACFGKQAVKSTWSAIYRAQSSEAAPAGKLDVWSDCEEDSDEKLDCTIFWKKPPLSVVGGRVLGYQVTVERNHGNLAVMDLSADAGPLGAMGGAEHAGGCGGDPCFRLPLSLRGVTGVCLRANTSQGVTDPAHLALPTPGPQLLAAGDLSVAQEGRSFNVSWSPPSHFTANVQYVVQLMEAGVRPPQAFNWIKLNGSQRHVILAGDFRNYTPYNISLFCVIADRRRLLGSAVAYTVQGVPPKVTGFQVSQISSTEVTLIWELPLRHRRGVILSYQLGLGNSTEYNVSGDSSSLLVGGLQPGQVYLAWISAESEAGQGPKAFLHFITTAARNEYVVHTVLPFAVLLAFGVIVLLFCCRQNGVHRLKQLGCCVKVPDATNSRLFRRAQQCSWSSWTGYVSVESIPKLSDLEVFRTEDVGHSGSPERSSLSDGRTHRQVREGLTRPEEGYAEDQAEDEWTDALDREGAELSGRGEDYSSRQNDYREMIDTEADEEAVSWSPTETQDIFSGRST